MATRTPPPRPDRRPVLPDDVVPVWNGRAWEAWTISSRYPEPEPRESHEDLTKRRQIWAAQAIAARRVLGETA